MIIRHRTITLHGWSTRDGLVSDFDGTSFRITFDDGVTLSFIWGPIATNMFFTMPDRVEVMISRNSHANYKRVSIPELNESGNVKVLSLEKLADLIEELENASTLYATKRMGK